MPDILLTLGVFLIIPILFCLDKDYVLGFFISLFITIFWCLWCGLYLYTPWEIETTKAKIYTSENIDFFILDNCFYNANAMLKKDFEDGETINLEKNKVMLYGGIFPCRPQQWRLSDVSVESTTSP